MSKPVDKMQKVIDGGERALLIDVLGDGENVRIIGEVFDHADGIVFADTEFCDPIATSHVYHVVKGRVTGNDPWRVGVAVIRSIGDDDDRWLEWREWQKQREKIGCTRERARMGIENDIGFD